MRAPNGSACTRTRAQTERFGREYLTNQAIKVVGTASQVADQFEEIHEATQQNDGIILEGCIATPDELREFVENVVPELQRRGLVKKEYAGSTLRANLAQPLPRPNPASGEDPVPRRGVHAGCGGFGVRA